MLYTIAEAAKATGLEETLILKAIERTKLKQAILYIERNPRLVRSITSFPYIVNSL